MADTDEVMPASKPEAAEPKVERGIVNTRQVGSLDKAALVIAAAQKAEYAALLGPGGRGGVRPTTGGRRGRLRRADRPVRRPH